MRKIVILTVMSFLLIAVMPAYAFRGVNPNAPGLPLATYGAKTAIANNQMSSMCVDCHTRIPRSASGADVATHYVSATLNGDSHSGGGWSVTTAVPADIAKSGGFRRGAEYFRVKSWLTAQGGSGGYSKYASGTTNLSYVHLDATDPLGLPDVDFTVGDEAKANDRHYFTSTGDGVGANFGAYDLICESCHNVISNVAGGNNMLAAPSSAVDWGQDAAEATMCVFCHGFMYDDLSTTIKTAVTTPGVADQSPNYADARNLTVTGAKRDVNHFHAVSGIPYDQNHHVGTNDRIIAPYATARLLWTDNYVLNYNDDPISNDSTLGTFPPAQPTWDGDKTNPATSNYFSCMSCHTPGHGGDISEAASLIRDTGALSGAGVTAIDRIQDRGWKNFNDPLYCKDCHIETTPQ